MLIKDRFVNRLDDVLWEVLLPKEKETELYEVMGRMAADMAKISLGKNVDLLKTAIIKLIKETPEQIMDMIKENKDV